MSFARITNNRDILTLIRMAAESLEVPCTKPHISLELSRVWDMWEAAVQSTIRGWARKHVHPDPDKWATRVIVEGDAPLNVYLTVNRHGAGIWDGRWDKFFIGNETYLDALHKHLMRYLENPWVDRLDTAFMDAAYDCAKILEFRNPFKR